MRRLVRSSRRCTGAGTGHDGAHPIARLRPAGRRGWLAWVLLFQWAGPEALSPPGATLRRAGEYLASATFWPHAAATAVAFAYACLIALTGGLALGFVLGANRLAGQVGEPILSSLYSIPKITLYPVILLVFGLGISAKVAFGALHGFFRSRSSPSARSRIRTRC